MLHYLLCRSENLLFGWTLMENASMMSSGCEIACVCVFRSVAFRWRLAICHHERICVVWLQSCKWKCQKNDYCQFSSCGYLWVFGWWTAVAVVVCYRESIGEEHSRVFLLLVSWLIYGHRSHLTEQIFFSSCPLQSNNFGCFDLCCCLNIWKTEFFPPQHFWAWNCCHDSTFLDTIID